MRLRTVVPLAVIAASALVIVVNVLLIPPWRASSLYVSISLKSGEAVQPAARIILIASAISIMRIMTPFLPVRRFEYSRIEPAKRRSRKRLKGRIEAGRAFRPPLQPVSIYRYAWIHRITSNGRTGRFSI